MSESGEISAAQDWTMTNSSGVRMNHTFQLIGIDHEQFEHLFDLTDEQLKEYNAERRFATESPGYPCRISLEDAGEGEELLLLPYLHQPATSPYRASGPIFVRRNVKQRKLAPGEMPSSVASRLISIRASDASHMIVSASVCEGSQTAQEILMQFRSDEVAYIHLHNAKRGCFSCQVVRA
jgi:hypothetical protein